MAWIAIVPPSARHPHERYQVRYQDGRRQRSVGIFPTMRRAEARRRARRPRRPRLRRRSWPLLQRELVLSARGELDRLVADEDLDR